jgi:hypothetical protein
MTSISLWVIGWSFSMHAASDLGFDVLQQVFERADGDVLTIA